MWRNCNFRHQKLYFGVILGQFRPKKWLKWLILVSYGLNLVIWSLFRLWRSLNYPFSWTMSWEMWPEVVLKRFRHQKNIFWASRKSIWGPKRQISESYELNLAIWGLIRLGDPLDGPFFWSMLWEMRSKVVLKHFRHQFLRAMS